MIIAEVLRNKTNETTGANACSYDAAGNPVYAVSAFRWAAKVGDATIIYLGEAVTGSLDSVAAWRITEINTAAATIKQAGAGKETQIWDDRESLLYA